MPGASHSRRTTGSSECVVAQTTPAPRIAVLVGAGRARRQPRARSSSASSSACRRAAAGDADLAEVAHERHGARVRARLDAGPDDREHAASARASSRTESAEPAPVRSAVIAVPSISRERLAVAGSNAPSSAWCVGSGPSALRGNSVTSLAASAPSEGT